MDPNQPTYPPQQPQQPVPQPGIPPQLPGQVVGSPDVQPVTSQQPYGQPVYAGNPQQLAPSSQYSNQYQPAPSGKSKKKLIVIAGVTLIVIGVASFFLLGGVKQIVNQVVGVELENYTNSSFAFSMQVPKGWTHKEYNQGPVKEVSFTEPVGDVKDQSEANTNYASMQVNYKFTDKDYMEQASGQAYFDNIKKGLQRSVAVDKQDQATSSYTPETATIESEEATTVNGLTAYKVKLKITNFDSKKGSIGYEYGLFVFIDKKNQYEISLRAHEAENVNSKAHNILDSFTKV